MPAAPFLYRCLARRVLAGFQPAKRTAGPQGVGALWLRSASPTHPENRFRSLAFAFPPLSVILPILPALSLSKGACRRKRTTERPGATHPRSVAEGSAVAAQQPCIHGMPFRLLPLICHPDGAAPFAAQKNPRTTPHSLQQPCSRDAFPFFTLRCHPDGAAPFAAQKDPRTTPHSLQPSPLSPWHESCRSPPAPSHRPTASTHPLLLTFVHSKVHPLS